jgi:hypothetical protein
MYLLNHAVHSEQSLVVQMSEIKEAKVATIPK